MLEGITVLSQTAIEDANLLWFVVPAVVIFLGSVFVAASIDMHETLAGIVSVMLAFLVGGACYAIRLEPTGEYKYEVTVEESVSMTEFYERYDVIEQRGEIYVIEKKEKDND